MDTDLIAARIESRFNCDVFVLAATTAKRPAGGVLTTHDAVERQLRGRLRVFKSDTDALPVGGAAGTAATWLVTTSRFSGVPVDAVLMVVADDRSWSHRLKVVGVRDAKSAYVADRLACVPA